MLTNISLLEVGVRVMMVLATINSGSCAETIVVANNTNARPSKSFIVLPELRAYSEK